jgi:hypothetical protein
LKPQQSYPKSTSKNPTTHHTDATTPKRKPHQFKEKIKGKSRQILNTHSIQTENPREKQAEIEEKRISPMMLEFRTLGARVLTSSPSIFSSTLSLGSMCVRECERETKRGRRKRGKRLGCAWEGEKRREERKEKGKENKGEGGLLDVYERGGDLGGPHEPRGKDKGMCNITKMPSSLSKCNIVKWA